METVLIAVGALLPMLLVLVAVHEFGHYATAKALGVKALEFGFGFPPRAFGFYTGNTTVVIDSLTQVRQRRRARRPGPRPGGDRLFRRRRLREPGCQDHRRSGTLLAKASGANDSDEDFLEQAFHSRPGC